MCHPYLSPALDLPNVLTEQIEIRLAGEDAIPVTLGHALDSAGDGRVRPVVVLSDMFGCTPFYRHLVSRLAVAGFDALLPNYFFRYPELAAHQGELAIARWRTVDEPRALADITTVLRTVADEYGTVGVVGFCLGGTFALDLASLATDIPMATVAYYGFPEHPGFARIPAPAPIELVERQRGPVLAFWGTEDDAVGPGTVERYVARAGQCAEDFQCVLYDGAPHGFLAKSELPSGVGVSDPAGDAWVRTIEHFQKRL